MRLILAGMLTLAACGDKTEPDEAEEADTDTDADSDADTDADTDADLVCGGVESGVYVARGPCFGMTMDVGLELNVDDCTFVLDDWSMNHGNLPEAGVVEGDQVTLSGGDYDDCVGTMDGGEISGTCPSGCAWVLNYDG